EAAHGEACPGELDRQRQADVPLADDGEPRGASLDAPVERGCDVHMGSPPAAHAFTRAARRARPWSARQLGRSSKTELSWQLMMAGANRSIVSRHEVSHRPILGIVSKG